LAGMIADCGPEGEIVSDGVYRWACTACEESIIGGADFGEKIPHPPHCAYRIALAALTSSSPAVTEPQVGRMQCLECHGVFQVAGPSPWGSHHASCSLAAVTDSERAEIRREALEDAAKVLCPYCRSPRYQSPVAFRDGFDHLDTRSEEGDRYFCLASPIRRLMDAIPATPEGERPRIYLHDTTGVNGGCGGAAHTEQEGRDA
jgi:hypothetical protein